MLAWCAFVRVQHAGLGHGKSLACQTRTRFSTLNSKSSMLDFLWGVQDRESCAIPRDSSRAPHSPHAPRLHEGQTCLV